MLAISITIMAEASIDCIPDPVLLYIFHHLDLKQLCMARAVCRRWNIVAETPSLWKVVNAVRYELKIPAVRSLVQSCVKSSTNSLRLIAKPATRRSGLNALTNEILDDIRERAPNIRKIYFEKFDVRLCSSECLAPSITHLIIQFGYWVPNWLQNAVGRLPQLEYLNLSENIQLQNSDLHIVSQFVSLKQLHISNCLLVGDEGIQSACKTLTELRVLNIAFTQCTKLSLETISKSLPYLEVIDISNCYLITDEEVADFLKTKPSLKKIAVHHVYLSPDAPDLFTRRVWTRP